MVVAVVMAGEKEGKAAHGRAEILKRERHERTK